MFAGLIQNFWPRSVAAITPGPKPPKIITQISLETLPPQGLISNYGVCNANSQPELDKHEDGLRDKIAAWVKSKLV